MKKIRGSSLVAALIFAFALMIIISALAYNFKMDSLSINTLVDEKQNLNVDEGYFGNIVGTTDFSSTTEENIGDFSFITRPNSIVPKFDYENTNAELYNADPYLISYDIKHEFYNAGVLKHIRNFIYNILPNSIMTQYGENTFPLNVPFVNADAMTGNIANYKLSIHGEVLDRLQGYIGYIQKNANTLNIYAISNSSVNVPSDLNVNNYKLAIGWNLSGGYWSIFLIVYDGSKAYTSSTTLNNLVTNNIQAQTDLSNWQQVQDVPVYYPIYLAGTTYHNGDIVASGNNLYICKEAGWCSSVSSSYYEPGNGSAWQQAWDLVGSLDPDQVGDPGNIIVATWYHDANNQEPKPLILRKTQRSGNYDLDVYMTTYNSATKIFTANLADSFTTGATDFDDSQVHIVIPDSLFVLDAGVPLIFQGTNIFDFNALGSYLLGSGTGGSTRGILAAAATDKPVLIKRNATQLLIAYFNGSTYYKYLYSLGVAAPTSLPSRDFPGETIQKIIAKFGVLFIITNSNIYVEDIANNNLISSVAIAGSNYQILRDGDGRIYAIADGLSCTISSNCTNAARVYFDNGCAAYNACSSLESLENVQPYLNMVYKSFE
ncbi:hypothetical protein [Francisella tularensis]|uniref:hypothetical protein n=1 Tax=Francisella tularensis TaxID=263 RepID=UPI0001855255|nr:hypothetical protein [Francisella tularensis]EDZ90040.1 hypothetical protein FTG_0231 [Francisella tularensis subsp. novicida FTG]MBK2334968.1 hypothetical protein [Francisella tularensis subsp. novicida]